MRGLIWADQADTFVAFLSYSWKTDAAVAPFIQTALQRFLCPWYKLRALNIFRDLASLPASSNLNASLETKLNQSKHLIVLASRSAATSAGMEFETSAWFARTRSGDVFVVVTDPGCATWEEVRQNLLPPSARKKLESPPLWLDISDVCQRIRGRNTVTDAELVDSLSQLVLAFYPNKTWPELRGEERRQRRRALTLVWTVVLALALTAGVAVQKAIEANRQTRIAQAATNEAVNSADIAKQQRQAAQESAKIADEQRRNAVVSATRAVTQQRIAEEQRREAERQRDQSLAQQVLLAPPTPDMDVQRLLLVESLRRGATALGLESAWQTNIRSLLAVNTFEYPPPVEVETPDLLFNSLVYGPAPINGFGVTASGDVVVTSAASYPFNPSPRYAWFGSYQPTSKGFRLARAMRDPKGEEATTSLNGQPILATADSNVGLFAPLSEKPEQILSHTTTVHVMTVNPEGTRIAVTTVDDSLSLYTRDRSFALERTTTLPGVAKAFAWRPNDWPLWLLSNEGSLLLFELDRGAVPVPIRVPEGDRYKVVLAVSSAGPLIGVGSEAGEVHLAAARGLPFWTFAGSAKAPVTALAFSRDAKFIGVGFADGEACTVEVSSGRARACTNADSAVAAILFGPEPQQMTVVTSTRAVVFALSPEQRATRRPLARDEVADVVLRNGASLHCSTHEGVTLKSATGRGWSRKLDTICDLAVNQDQSLVALSTRDGVSVIRLADGTERRASIRDGFNRWGPVAFSSSGRHVAVAQNRTWVVDVASLRVRAVGGLSVNNARTVAISSDGQRVASSDERSVRIASVSSAVNVEVEDRFEFVRALKFSPDGRQLAIGSENELRVVSASTGGTRWRSSNYASEAKPHLRSGGFLDYLRSEQVREASRLTTQRRLGRVLSLGYSTDGAVLVAGTTEGTAAAFDSASGRNIVTLELNGKVIAVEVSGHNSTLTTTTVEHDDSAAEEAPETQAEYLRTSSHVIDPRVLARELCAKVTRDMRPDEWDQYLPQVPYRPICPSPNKFAFNQSTP